jgi:hypothetical protein
LPVGALPDRGPLLKWLIEKTHAHIEEGWLVSDSAEAKKLFENLGSVPVHDDGDRFRAKPRRDIPENENRRRQCGAPKSPTSRKA